LIPNGLTFGATNTFIYGILLFFSIDVKFSSLLMISFQAFSYYNLNKKNYKVGLLIEGASFVFTILIILANLQI